LSDHCNVFDLNHKRSTHALNDYRNSHQNKKQNNNVLKQQKRHILTLLETVSYSSGLWCYF